MTNKRVICVCALSVKLKLTYLVMLTGDIYNHIVIGEDMRWFTLSCGSCSVTVTWIIYDLDYL